MDTYGYVSVRKVAEPVVQEKLARNFRVSAVFPAVFPAENALFGQNHDLNRFFTTEKRAESESGIRFLQKQNKKIRLPKFSPHIPKQPILSNTAAGDPAAKDSFFYHGVGVIGSGGS